MSTVVAERLLYGSEAALSTELLRATAEQESEYVYEEVRGRLDEFYTSDFPERMQCELGVYRAGLQELGERYGHTRLEVNQTEHTFNNSYKINGAGFALLSARARTPNLKTVYTASAGNHGEALAAAGKQLGLEVVVAAAKEASPAKLALIRDLGATLDDSYNSLPEALWAAQQAGQDNDSVFIHPYNDLDVIAGQSLIGVQLVEDLLARGTQGRVVVPAPVGGGGFASGLYMGSRYARECFQASGDELPFTIEFIGVQMQQGDPARRAVQNYLNGLDHESLEDLFPCDDADRSNDGTFAVPGNLTLPTLASRLQGIGLISKAEVGAAMRRLAGRHYKRYEPAAALSEAAAEAWVEANAVPLSSDEAVTVVSYLTGSNVTLEHYEHFMQADLEEYRARLRSYPNALGRLACEKPTHTEGLPTLRVWSSSVTRRMVQVG